MKTCTKTNRHCIYSMNFYMQVLLGLLFSVMLHSCSNSRKVILLSSDYTTKIELDSLTSILADEKNEVVMIPVDKLTESDLKNADVVCYHRMDTASIDGVEKNLCSLLLPYVENGGKLLLSMEAVRLLNAWKIEPSSVEVEYQDATDNGFGRALGYHGYREHPIYEGLHGGAYVWKSVKDHKARTLGFSGNHLPAARGAKVLGINWAYIHYHENRKLVWETPLGEGKVLAIGGYLYFSEQNLNRSTLEIFIHNVFDYLAGSRPFSSAEKSWPCDSVTVEQATFPEKYSVLEQPVSSWVPDRQEGLAGIRTGQDGHYWNVAGQQIVAMGLEKGPIEEVWIHPVMAMRDWTVGIVWQDTPDVLWLKDLPVEVTKTPGYMCRSFLLPDGSRLREYIMVALEEPFLSVRYKWETPSIKQLYVIYATNLRLMWPYSLESTGRLVYGMSEDGRMGTVSDRAGELNILTAFAQRPRQAKAGSHASSGGRLEDFSEGVFNGKKIEYLYVFDGAEKQLDFCMAGGEDGLDKSFSVLASNAGQLPDLYRRAAGYYDGFADNYVSIESSDTAFNQAYRWALVSVDKFFAHSPSLGKSLMSGYWTTSRGWNGGHAVSGRPGYAWYFGRDTELTGLAMNAYGAADKVKDILQTFGKFQSPDGKIYHELTTSGSVHYDAADATPLYVILAGDYLRTTGDIDFIRSQWPFIRRAMDFCYSTDTDGDLLIENTNVGHGWQEGWQLYGAHTEVYLASLWAAALKEASYLADALGDSQLKDDYHKDMCKVKDLINGSFWNDSLQFFNHGLMKDGTFQEQKCVLGGTPVVFGLADREKALQTASNFSSKYYSTDWGVRMVGYDSPYYALGGYNYGNIWPFHTGCAALAEYQAGLRMQGFRHAYGSLRLFTCWDYGNVAEVILGDQLRFTGICPHQQWSSAMNLLPLYRGMLGLESDALHGVFALAPAFPADWETAEVKNMHMGNNKVHLNYRRLKTGYSYELTQEGTNSINVSFSAVLPLGTRIRTVEVNGRKADFEIHCEPQNIKVVLTQPLCLDDPCVVEVIADGGIATLLNFTPLSEGMPDDGLKLVSETFDESTGTYTLKLGGKRGKTYDVEIWSRQPVKEVCGGTLKTVKDNNRYIYTLHIPAGGDEPFVDHWLKLETEKLDKVN